MKACVLHKMGDFRFEDVAEPASPGADELVVGMLRGGICGSDMHYYKEGGIGELIRVRQPIILGHEGVGVVQQTGSGVTKVKEGDMVAIRPARPCFSCQYCKKRMYTYCENMRHLGSASTNPHVNGLFAEKVLLHESQAHRVEMDPVRAAFAEPLAVAFNGVRQLGELFGKSLLVMGAGPIGCLCVSVAKLMGIETVTVVDVRQEPLDICLRMGADEVCNSIGNPEQIQKWKEHKGAFDLMLDASGNGRAVMDGMYMTRPEGIVSQVGMFGPTLPTELGMFTTKGLQWRGVQRFYDEFTAAARALEKGFVDPMPLFSGQYSAEQCDAAMQAALSPETSKIQIVLS